MKNLLLILILIIGSAYYFVPNDMKIKLFDKVWIDGSMLLIEEKKVGFEKGEVVELNFDDETNKDSFKWNISNWEIMKDLSWASLPYVKCFYKNDYNKFNWNVVLHKVILWKKKDITVKLITDSDLNMYVYKTDALNDVYPPEKEYVHDCKTSINTSTIDMNWNTVTSDIVIWVVWNNWVLEWNYTLELIEK